MGGPDCPAGPVLFGAAGRIAEVEPNAGLSQVEARANHEAQTPACGPGSSVTGVGGKVADDTDGSLIDRFEVNVSLNRASTATGDNAMVGTPHAATAFAICSD